MNTFTKIFLLVLFFTNFFTGMASCKEKERIKEDYLKIVIKNIWKSFYIGYFQKNKNNQ
jgi:hypothetical protein